MATKTTREDEIAEQIAEAAPSSEIRELVDLLAELRKQGVLSRPEYRLTSPYGSGMEHLAKD